MSSQMMHMLKCRQYLYLLVRCRLCLHFRHTHGAVPQWRPEASSQMHRMHLRMLTKLQGSSAQASISHHGLRFQGLNADFLS